MIWSVHMYLAAALHIYRLPFKILNYVFFSEPEQQQGSYLVPSSTVFSSQINTQTFLLVCWILTRDPLL